MKKRVNVNNKEKKKKIGKHKKKVLRVLVYIVLVLFMLSLFFLIGYGIYYFSTSSKYNITKVEFKNNNVYDTETLKEVISLHEGKNIYKTSKKDIISKLEELPYIEKVSVKKIIPDALQITITEHISKYFAYNEEIDKYVRLTRDGRVLEITDGENRLNNELLVFGISFDDNLKLKSIIAKTELDKLELYEKTRKVYDNVGLQKEITNIEFVDKNIIITLDSNINVTLNDNNLEYDIRLLNSILEKIVGKSGNIDMTKQNPVFTESIR